MMARKTFEVEALRQHVNNNLDRNKNAELFEQWVDLQVKEGYTPVQIARLTLATVLEGILFRTDNYHGFGHRDGNLGVVDPTLREYY
jgi:hypothetical protein